MFVPYFTFTTSVFHRKMWGNSEKGQHVCRIGVLPLILPLWYSGSSSLVSAFCSEFMRLDGIHCWFVDKTREFWNKRFKSWNIISKYQEFCRARLDVGLSEPTGSNHLRSRHRARGPRCLPTWLPTCLVGTRSYQKINKLGKNPLRSLKIAKGVVRGKPKHHIWLMPTLYHIIFFAQLYFFLSIRIYIMSINFSCTISWPTKFQAARMNGSKIVREQTYKAKWPKLWLRY